MQTNLKELIHVDVIVAVEFYKLQVLVHVDVRGIYFHSKAIIVCFKRYCFLHFLTIFKENVSVNEVQCKFM